MLNKNTLIKYLQLLQGILDCKLGCAGGAFRDLDLGLPLGDIDLFFVNSNIPRQLEAFFGAKFKPINSQQVTAAHRPYLKYVIKSPTLFVGYPISVHLLETPRDFSFLKDYALKSTFGLSQVGWFDDLYAFSALYQTDITNKTMTYYGKDEPDLTAYYANKLASKLGDYKIVGQPC